METKELQQLNWRYATKKFDTAKKLTADQLDILLSAIQLAPSSYGIQPFKVIVVTDPAVREELKLAAYGQSQITDASQLLVFAIHADFNETHIDDFATNIVETRGITLEDIGGYVEIMKGTVKNLTQEQLQIWNAKQAYIALGFLLETAAIENIDACPMEGFNAARFDEILGLEDKNLKSVVIATVGFRAEDDNYQFYKKVRHAKSDMFIHI
jgi:nitroreductase